MKKSILIKLVASTAVVLSISQACSTSNESSPPPANSTTSESYLSGDELKKQYPAIVSQEQGKTIYVPVNYSNPTGSKTPIYYHFVSTFDSKRPTVVVFSGGPGGGSHYEEDRKTKLYGKLNFNIILFDQRGIGFSRPFREATFNDPAFYSP